MLSKKEVCMRIASWKAGFVNVVAAGTLAAVAVLVVVLGCTVPAGAAKDKHIAAPKTALAVTRDLRATGLPVGAITNYTASTDPNHLLGRPNGYKSKTAFVDTTIANPTGTPTSVTRGGSVEFFANHIGAVRREHYIEKLEKADPILGTEYDYVHGSALLRLSSLLTPSEAKVYKQMLADVMAGKKVTVEHKHNAPSATKPTKAAPTTPTTSAATPAAAVTIAATMGGTAKPSLSPGIAGKLDVIFTGTPEATSTTTVPFILWNGTSRTLSTVDVAGSASINGSIVGSGNSQDVEPTDVAPGQAVFGMVYFGHAVPPGAAVSLSATSKSGTSGYEASVQVTQANYVAGNTTGTSATVAGAVTNTGSATVDSPISVSIYCFTGSALMAVAGDFVSGTANLAPGASGSFSTSVPASCTTFLVGASGHVTSR